jgi:metal-sulfur cluster biosynthetic enzyme
VTALALDSEDAMLSLVRRVADEIHDPCGKARGLALGMEEMGLLRSVGARRDERGWTISVCVRFTDPGCLYYPYFERALTERLSACPGVAAVTIAWDSVCDWTPGDLRASARAKLGAHNDRLIAAAELRRIPVSRDP